MKIDTVWQELQARGTFTEKDMQWLYCRFYDVYNQGLQEGKQEIKDKLVNNLITLMETE